MSKICCLMKMCEIKKELVEKEVLTMYQRDMDSSTSSSETSKNVFLFVFISLFVSFEVCKNMQHFFDSVRNQASDKKSKITSSLKEYVS